MVKVFLSHGTEKLSHGTWTTVSLARVDSVEVLLEWRQDPSEGDGWTLLRILRRELLPIQPAGLARKIEVTEKPSMTSLGLVVSIFTR